MGFNPSWPDQYKPTDTTNGFQLVDSIGQYSDQSDTITNAGYPVLLRGKYILLHGGDDTYVGTDFDSPGWDNIVNGNRGVDDIRGHFNSRDFLRGGKEDDVINGMAGGDDFVLGDAGDDLVLCSLNGRGILRGGKGNDTLTGGNNVDLLIGDYGKDRLTGLAGRDYFVFRTDKEDGVFNNLTTNRDEVDTVTDFKIADDYIVLPGVDSHNEIQLEKVLGTANDYYVKILQSDFSSLYAGRVNSDGALVANLDFIVGSDANKVYAAGDGNDPSSFLANSSVFDVMA